MNCVILFFIGIFLLAPTNGYAQERRKILISNATLSGVDSRSLWSSAGRFPALNTCNPLAG